MTCQRFGNAIVCVTAVDESKIVTKHCHGRCNVPREMLAEHEEWYGWTLTCLTCGDSWQDGQRSERPFERGWRKRVVTSARARAKAAQEGG